MDPQEIDGQLIFLSLCDTGMVLNRNILSFKRISIGLWDGQLVVSLVLRYIPLKSLFYVIASCLLLAKSKERAFGPWATNTFHVICIVYIVGQ